MRSDLSVINVYKKKSTKSKLLSTQLLYGDSFNIIKKTRSWIKIKNNLDGYKGFIKKRKFPTNKKITHKVYNISADLYRKPNSKFKVNKKISFGSKINITKKKINFISLIISG